MNYIQVIFENTNKYRIINESDDVISFGANYTLEKFENDEWVNVLGEDHPCILILYHLEPHSSEVYPIDMELESGLYRLGKYIEVPEKGETIFINGNIYIK